MKELILTVYPKKNTTGLQETGKPSIPKMRKALKQIDLDDCLILSTDPKISKIFKPDYSFNDHGIYYNLSEHPETGESINAVVVFAEMETKERDYQRFLHYGTFEDPILNYTVTTDLHSYFDNRGTTYFLDIETTGLDFTKHELTLLSVKDLFKNEVLILDNPSVEDVRYVLGYLENEFVVMHNGVFDLSWLMYYCGMQFAPNIQTIDTMLLAHVAGERRLSLKHLSMMYGNFKGRRNTLSADHAYLIEDILTTELLYNKFGDKYKTFSGRLVCEAVKTFSEVKVNGVHIDETILFKLRDEYAHLETEQKYNFNVNSNRELADYFIRNGVKLTAKTARGDISVDQKTLQYFTQYPVVQEYLDYKAELNIYQKYIHPYCQLQEFHLRPDIKLWGTETGRLSCSNPNVQQIPNRSKFKDIFRSRFEGGYIATIDLDRAELGIAALLSGDTEYAKALTSQDFHRLVASKTFNKPEDQISKLERFTAKSVNFGGVLYGGSAKGIAARINVEHTVVEQVQKWYKKAFPVLTKWIESGKLSAKYTGQVVTYFGRVRYLHDYRPDQRERIGVNTAVQSVANDVMLYIVTRLSGLLRKENLKSKILFPVHDELLLDIHPEELEQVVELLKIAFRDLLKTPIGNLELSSTLPISGTLEYGESWLFLKSDKYQPLGKFYISSLGE